MDRCLWSLLMELWAVQSVLLSMPSCLLWLSFSSYPLSLPILWHVAVFCSDLIGTALLQLASVCLIWSAHPARLDCGLPDLIGTACPCWSLPSWSDRHTYPAWPLFLPVRHSSASAGGCLPSLSDLIGTALFSVGLLFALPLFFPSSVLFHASFLCEFLLIFQRFSDFRKSFLKIRLDKTGTPERWYGHAKKRF